MLHVPTTLGPLRSNPTTLGEAFSLARFEDERSTTSIAKPNDLNTGIHVQDIEETIRHKPNKVEVVKTSRVATSEEHEHQENQDNLNEISEEKDDAKPPISTDTFRSNGGDDSQTSGLKIPTKDVVDNGNGSTLTFLVGYGSLRALQLWEKVGIEDVLGLLDIGGEHNFAQSNAGIRKNLGNCKEVDNKLKDRKVERDVEREGEPNIMATFGSDRVLFDDDTGKVFPYVIVNTKEVKSITLNVLAEISQCIAVGPLDDAVKPDDVNKCLKWNVLSNEILIDLLALGLD
ncbi:hypothetical protein Tco_0381166 [Tanacetum coccineum]